MIISETTTLGEVGVCIGDERLIKIPTQKTETTELTEHDKFEMQRKATREADNQI